MGTGQPARAFGGNANPNYRFGSYRDDHDSHVSLLLRGRTSRHGGGQRGVGLEEIEASHTSRLSFVREEYWAVAVLQSWSKPKFRRWVSKLGWFLLPRLVLEAVSTFSRPFVVLLPSNPPPTGGMT